MWIKLKSNDSMENYVSWKKHKNTLWLELHKVHTHKKICMEKQNVVVFKWQDYSYNIVFIILLFLLKFLNI